MESINSIYFSPTHTTKTIANTLANDLCSNLVNQINLTKSDFEINTDHFNADSISIIGMPVYSGRLPLDAVVRFLNIDGKGSKAIVLVVYGNREFDDALLELAELAQKANFQVIAAAAFIGEHSYSTPRKPIAANRPDANDLMQIHAFSRQIKVKMETANRDHLFVLEQLPGNRPFVERKQRPALAPETNSSNCTLCGACAESCPTGAITVNRNVFTDAEKCIWCCACIKQCPEQARTFDVEIIQTIRERLFNNCGQRKEPQFFL